MGIFQRVDARVFLVIDSGSQDGMPGIVPLQNALSYLECNREVVHSVDEGRDRIQSTDLLALILSGWKPDNEGLDLLSFVRGGWPILPILVAGSPEYEEAGIAAYEAGADEYIVPNCSEREIIARIKGLLRRSENTDAAISIFDLEMRADSRVAFRAGQPISLSSKEMAILFYLAANRSKPVSRSQLLKDVFGLSHEPGTNIVEVHIHRIRHKLDHGHAKKLLNTVRGVGYVLG